MSGAHRVEPLRRIERFCDTALVPVMFVLGGCRRDSLQETHFWHCQRLSHLEIDPALTVSVTGDDPSPFTNAVFPFPFFHAPVLGGWSHYVVMRVEDTVRPWHVGWIHLQWPPGSRPRSHVQRLPLCQAEVRVLTHPRGFDTLFVAFAPDGRQLPLRCVGNGVLGDQRFAATRLL